MTKSVKVTISLPYRLAEFVDRLALERQCPKSRLIAELLAEKELRIQREALIQGYEALAEENRRFAEEALPLAAEAWPGQETPSDREGA